MVKDVDTAKAIRAHAVVSTAGLAAGLTSTLLLTTTTPNPGMGTAFLVVVLSVVVLAAMAASALLAVASHRAIRDRPQDAETDAEVQDDDA